MTIYRERRKKFFDQLHPGDVAILCAAPEVMRSKDVPYPYQQNKNFYYLTGFPEANAIAVFIPGRAAGEYILFNQAKDPKAERWTGLRVGQKAAITQYHVDESHDIADFNKELPTLLAECKRVFLPFVKDNHLLTQVFECIEETNEHARKGECAPYEMINLSPKIHEMRLIKSEYEIAAMKFAAQVSAKAHLRAMEKCQVGMHEYELEAVLMETFISSGCRYPAYESIVASGNNACVLHYVANNAQCRDGDLILIDAGAEYEHYAADLTRTFPANGKFSKEQAAIYDLVLASQQAAINLIKPGVAWHKLQEKIIEVITQGLIDLGILQGELNSLIETKAYMQFYMHNSGHWLGMDVHDVGLYKIADKWRPLEENMVFTVEPGIYIDNDQNDVDEKWRGIGIRIEDDIQVTKNGCLILTAEVPKDREAIEKIMAAG